MELMGAGSGGRISDGFPETADPAGADDGAEERRGRIPAQPEPGLWRRLSDGCLRCSTLGLAPMDMCKWICAYA